jgi:hypothetical protein
VAPLRRHASCVVDPSTLAAPPQHPRSTSGAPSGTTNTAAAMENLLGALWSSSFTMLSLAALRALELQLPWPTSFASCTEPPSRRLGGAVHSGVRLPCPFHGRPPVRRLVVVVKVVHHLDGRALARRKGIEDESQGRGTVRGWFGPRGIGDLIRDK